MEIIDVCLSMNGTLFQPSYYKSSAKDKRSVDAAKKQKAKDNSMLPKVLSSNVALNLVVVMLQKKLILMKINKLLQIVVQIP